MFGELNNGGQKCLVLNDPEIIEVEQECGQKGFFVFGTFEVWDAGIQIPAFICPCILQLWLPKDWGIVGP